MFTRCLNQTYPPNDLHAGLDFYAYLFKNAKGPRGFYGHRLMFSIIYGVLFYANTLLFSAFL
jgi:hypothetical protein